MKGKTLRIALSCILLFVGIAGGIYCLSTPKAYSGPDPARFSSVSATGWIKTIAARPHSVADKEEHVAVREYLAGELNKLGLKVEIKEFSAQNLEGFTVNNIHANLDGLSDNAILLTAHYDSASRWDQETWTPLPGDSYGAADDGYGLATILETLRAIKAMNKPLENDIRVLFTDAEEIGCIGAYVEMDQNRAAFDNVRLVINLEARGVKGPAVMFETGVNNSAVADYYIKHAVMPFSYSFATDIYHIMPNATDFTSFVRNGFTGYNFSVLDNLDYYHSKNDNYGNIDLNSLQHYGDQVCPIVADFAFTPSDQLPSFGSDSGSDFFNILPGVIVEFPYYMAFIIIGLSIFLLVLFVMIARKKNEFRIAGMFSVFGRVFGSLAAAAILGTLAAYAASLIFKRPYHITYLPKIPFAWLILASVLVMTAWIFTLIIKKPGKRSVAGFEAIAGGVLVNILISVITSVILPGCVFPFALPALLASIYLFIAGTSRNLTLLTPAFALVAIFIPVLFVPLVYMLYLALTIGSAGILAAFEIFALATLVPVLRHYSRTQRS